MEPIELLATLDLFFASLAGSRAARSGPGRGEGRPRLVVAFSGGVDSTALLWGLARLARFDLVAAHLDHALDPGSAARAEAAARLARALGVPLVAARRPIDPDGRDGTPGREASAGRGDEIEAAARGDGIEAAARGNGIEATGRRDGIGPAGRRGGIEAAARRARYRFLEEVREHYAARWVATAHHLDDQAETVLLRLLLGSGVLGLAGMRPVAGKVVRPLLSLPRAALAAAVAAAGLAAAGLPAVEDPGNRDLARPRNRIRHRLLPALAGTDGEAELAARLAHLARRAAGAAEVLDQRLARELDLRAGRPARELDLRAGRLARELDLRAGRPARELDLREGQWAGDLALWAETAGEARWSLDLERLRGLPRSLWPAALAALHRRAGAGYPAPAAARAELGAQVAGGGAIGCDCGAGWRWAGSGGRLELRRGSEKIPHFTYTLEVPGERDIPEIGLRLRLARSPVEPWMFRGEPRRAGLALPLHEGACVTVRSRLPGDRLQPLGARGGRRLKELLIDRRIPRCERERLPLLCAGGQIAWVPGVTIDQRCRVPREGAARAGRTVWVAELVPGNPHPRGPVVERKGPTVPLLEANSEPPATRGSS